MVTIDPNGAWHDSEGKYANQNKPAAGFDLDATEQAASACADCQESFDTFDDLNEHQWSKRHGEYNDESDAYGEDDIKPYVAQVGKYAPDDENDLFPAMTDGAASNVWGNQASGMSGWWQVRPDTEAEAETEAVEPPTVPVMEVEPGTRILYTYQGADGPHTVDGIVAQPVGMSRLGNQGFRVDGCPCGEPHNISRHARVEVVETATAALSDELDRNDAENAAARTLDQRASTEDPLTDGAVSKEQATRDYWAGGFAEATSLPGYLLMRGAVESDEGAQVGIPREHLAASLGLPEDDPVVRNVEFQNQFVMNGEGQWVTRAEAARSRPQVGTLRKANPLHGDHHLYDTADGLRTIKIEYTGYTGQFTVSEAFHPADPPSSGWHERGTLWAPGYGPAQSGARGDRGIYSYTNAHGTFFAGTTIESAAEALARSTRPVAADRDVEGEYTQSEAFLAASLLLERSRGNRKRNAHPGGRHTILSPEHEAVLERFGQGESVRADELHAALSDVFGKFGWTKNEEFGPFDQAGRLATYIDNHDND